MRPFTEDSFHSVVYPKEYIAEVRFMLRCRSHVFLWYRARLLGDLDRRLIPRWFLIGHLVIDADEEPTH